MNFITFLCLTLEISALALVLEKRGDGGKSFADLRKHTMNGGKSKQIMDINQLEKRGNHGRTLTPGKESGKDVVQEG